MSTLTMVRHGQAHAFHADPDRLTETGEAQALALADYWLGLGLRIDEACAGSLVRQQQTARIVAQRFAAAGRPFPEIRTLEGLNEYPAEAMLRMFVPALAKEDAGFRDLEEAWRASADGAERTRRFQRMFEAVIAAWVGERVDVPGIESWESFQGRVWGAIRLVVGEGKSGVRIAVFTSGGPIGVTAQRVLAAPPGVAVELNWRVRNGSLTEFVFSGDRITLDSFNAIPHLRDRSLWTYR